MNKQSAGIDENDNISNQSSALLLNNELININEKMSNLLKINPFQKNTITKVDAPNHQNSEFKINKISTSPNTINPIQSKLVEIVNNKNYFEIKERKVINKIDENNSDYDYSRKSIIEVKPKIENSANINELKKNFEDQLKNLQNNQNTKIDDSNKMMNYKINESKKELIEVIDEKIISSQQKIIEKIEIDTKIKLNQFKNDLLRS